MPSEPTLEADAAPRSRAADVTIRPREPEDYAGLADLMALPGVRWGTLRLPFASKEETRKFLQANAERTTALVAVVADDIVGAASLTRHAGRRDHAGVIGITVHDAWTRCGIGTRLLTALIDVADRWLNLRRMELTVFVDNAPAIRLYERFGFAIEGTHRGFAFRDGRFVDAHAMARLRPT